MDPANLGMGAEAIVKKIIFKGVSAVSKVRIVKQYRHPTLDQKLRSRRTAMEARCLERAAKAGVAVPAVLHVDKKFECSIVMEYVAGVTLRAYLQQHSPAGSAIPPPSDGPSSEDDDAAVDGDSPDDPRPDADPQEPDAAAAMSLEASPAVSAASPAILPAPVAASPAPSAASAESPSLPPEMFYRGAAPLPVLYREIACRVGTALARLHDSGLCHGDLTTSNMLLREGTAELVLIDFGLAFVSASPEDKAVDLYVLERALLATHPNARELFDGIMACYERTSAKGKDTIARLAKVRARGRKKSMAG